MPETENAGPSRSPAPGAAGSPWPDGEDGLAALQDHLRRWAAEALLHDPFHLPPGALIGGCFVAFARGEAGPGRPGDRAFAAAVVWEPGHDALLRRGRGGVPSRSTGRALRGSRRFAPPPDAGSPSGPDRLASRGDAGPLSGSEPLASPGDAGSSGLGQVGPPGDAGSLSGSDRLASRGDAGSLSGGDRLALPGDAGSSGLGQVGPVGEGAGPSGRSRPPLGPPASASVPVARQAADVVDQAVVVGVVGDAYRPGLLALREGPILAAAVSALRRAPDVLLVDATGVDHPRRAGLALHLGWALGLPTVGITRRPLRAAGETPGPNRGDWTPLMLGGIPVAAAVRTRTGAQPVIAHAAWRTDVPTAVAVALAASTEGARAPVPLQEARRVARETRDVTPRP